MANSKSYKPTTREKLLADIITALRKRIEGLEQKVQGLAKSDSNIKEALMAHIKNPEAHPNIVVVPDYFNEELEEDEE